MKSGERKVGRISRFVLVASSMLAASAMPCSAGLFDNDPSSKSPPKTTAPAQAAPSQPDKFAIPTEPQRRAADKQVRDVLRAELSKAKAPADKSALAAQMLQTADGTADAAGRYVLIRDAEDLAADAADVNATLAAHEAALSQFQPDASPAAIHPLQKFTRAQVDADGCSRLCEAAFAILHNAVSLNRFDTAREAGRTAVALAHKSNDRQLIDRATGMLASVNADEAEYTRVLSSLNTLKKSPDDPAANAAVGRYECFVKGDWDGGLARLVKGNNDALKKAAADELKRPIDADGQLAVADAWWAQAEAQPAATQAAVRAHAAGWYSKALDKLSGLAKLKAEQRIAQAQPPAPKTEVATATPTASTGSSKPDKGSSTAPPPTDAPGEGVSAINGPMDIIRAVPPDMFPRNVVEWTPDKQQAVTHALGKSVGGQKGTFQIVPQEIRASSGRVYTRSVLLGKVSFNLIVLFDSEDRGQLSQLRIGVPYTVTGTVEFPRFDGMELRVMLEHASIMR